jgi:sigma-B regulation protein RsbU (phosphoserine phosphatase)
MRSWQTHQRQFWHSLPLQGYITFVLAVAATFSTMGFLMDLVSTELPFSHALYSAVFSGLIAVCWFVSVTRALRLLPVVIAVHFAGTWFISGPARHPPFAAFAGLSLEQRLRFDMFGALACVMLGYIGFVVFATREGRQWAAVDAEMRLARNIHQALVPRIERSIGSIEFHGFSAPSGHGGGDRVDVVTLPDGRWLGYIADVSGHGVSSGLLMAMVKSGMRMRSSEWPPLPALVRDLNQLICDQSTPQMFVTMACVRGSSDGSSDGASAGSVEFSLIGHPPILRVRAGAVTEVAESHIPLGIMPAWNFTSATLDIQPGDLLALVTDGLFEVFDAKDRDFGLEGIKQVLASASASASNTDRPLADIASDLLERVRGFGAQLDDQTLLLIRFR